MRGSLWSFELVSADLTQVEWGGAYVEYRTRTHQVERSHRVDAEEFYALLDGLVVSTTPKSSTTSSESGRTTTTTVVPTVASTAKLPTNDYARKPRPGRNR
jgi:hypothetical protein